MAVATAKKDGQVVSVNEAQEGVAGCAVAPSRASSSLSIDTFSRPCRLGQPRQAPGGLWEGRALFLGN